MLACMRPPRAGTFNSGELWGEVHRARAGPGGSGPHRAPAQLSPSYIVEISAPAAPVESQEVSPS
jgi:hypothetical protein